MTLSPKDQRLHRRYNSRFRQLSSFFMLVVVFPALTGLDGVAYDAVNELHGKNVREKYAHDQLREMAAPYLQGDLIPRLRTLAQKVKDSIEDRTAVDETTVKTQTKELATDLKRLKLALLDNVAKQKSNVGGAVPAAMR